MSTSTELQTLIYNLLVADAGVHAICADRIYDLPPKAAVYPYVSFGPSDVLDDDSDCINGEIEVIQLDCWSTAQDGFREVKLLGAAVKNALHKTGADLATHGLSSLRVTMVLYLRDPDGRTSHGVVQVSAIVEEA